MGGYFIKKFLGPPILAGLCIVSFNQIIGGWLPTHYKVHSQLMLRLSLGCDNDTDLLGGASYVTGAQDDVELEDKLWPRLLRQIDIGNFL